MRCVNIALETVVNTIILCGDYCLVRKSNSSRLSDHITSILDDEINVEPRQCEAHSLNHIVKMINAFYFSLIRVFDHSTAFMGKKCSARRGAIVATCFARSC